MKNAAPACHESEFREPALAALLQRNSLLKENFEKATGTRIRIEDNGMTIVMKADTRAAARKANKLIVQLAVLARSLVTDSPVYLSKLKR